jgi:hypothetical protein
MNRSKVVACVKAHIEPDRQDLEEEFQAQLLPLPYSYAGRSIPDVCGQLLDKRSHLGQLDLTSS